MNRKIPVFLFLSLALLGANAQVETQTQTAPDAAVPRRVISLEDAISGSLASGDDMKIAQGNLDAARALHALNLSKEGFALSAAGTGLVQGGLDGTVLGLSENIQGSLSLSLGNASASNPATKATLSAIQNFPEAEKTPTTTVAVSVSQSLWDGYSGGQTQAVIDKSILVFRGKELAAALARSSTVAKVKQAYVTALSAQRTLALRQGLVKKQQALLKQVEAMHSLKQASLIDLMTARINAESAGLDLETSNHDLSLARHRLSILMNLAPDADYDVAEIDTPGLPAPNAEAAIALGLSKRSDAVQIDLGRKLAAIDLVIAQGLSQPGISLSGGVNFGFGWDGSAANAQSANLGLRLSLPILDAGAANAQAAAASAQLAVLDAQYAQLGKNIAADIRDNYWLVSIQLKRVDLARQSADMLETQLSLVKAQNQFGTATTQDLLTAATNAANAEAVFAQARAGYLLSILALETAMGL